MSSIKIPLRIEHALYINFNSSSHQDWCIVASVRRWLAARKGTYITSFSQEWWISARRQASLGQTMHPTLSQSSNVWRLQTRTTCILRTKWIVFIIVCTQTRTFNLYKASEQFNIDPPCLKKFNTCDQHNLKPAPIHTIISAEYIEPTRQTIKSTVDLCLISVVLI